MNEIIVFVRNIGLTNTRKMFHEKKEENKNIRVYSDPIRVLNKISKSKEVLLIIDSNISKVTCFDFIDIVRSNPLNHHTKIIVASNSKNVAFLKKAYDLGADYFISYPIKLDELDKIINLLKEEKKLHTNLYDKFDEIISL